MTAIQYIETSGVSFVEFTGSKPHLLRALFKHMGLKPFTCKASEEITLHNSGDIRFISNPSCGGNTEVFRGIHNRGASAIGLLVEDSERAIEKAVELGAELPSLKDYDIPAIRGIGGSLIYLVDARDQEKLFEKFGFDVDRDTSINNNLQCIDHFTHNVLQGGIEKYKSFYNKFFGFDDVRSFDIEGKKTGLVSEVISSPCGRVIIPLNETKDDKSQIAEFIRDYNGEGIQHIALRSSDLCTTVRQLENNGIEFQDTPDTYYELIDERLPGHGEDVESLKELRILIDGGESQGGGTLLQIFTKNSIGPIFFEYIQRKGNKGFGEGNFQALFDSIELDQERRGVI